MTHRHRQERWLHTRISPDLEEALKREARRRRSPVSLVVRNVLEGALDLVEEIVEDSLAVARRSQRLARSVVRARPQHDAKHGRDDVYGWQELVLNRTAQCARCATPLRAGTSAHRGLRDVAGGPPVFLCNSCLRRLHRPSTNEEEESR